MSGHDVEIEWQGRPATAWMPDRLATRDLTTAERTVRAAEQAAGAVRRVGDRLPAGVEPLARLLLRAEGVASSNIEGLHAEPLAVAAAELSDAVDDQTADDVAANLRVVAAALAHARGSAPLDGATLQAWHHLLMAGSSLPAERVGRFRSAQSWIGGTSPRDAAFVPPLPGDVPGLVDDLLSYLADEPTDAVTQAAIAHAQLETIHPWGDGNGRVGRLVVIWTLARRLEVAVPPATSVLIARDPGGYLAGLHDFRAGSLDRWVRWFAGVVDRASERALAWTDEVDEVLGRWDDATADLRTDASALAALGVLPAHPVLDVASLARMLEVSDVAARTALRQLEERGVVRAWRETTGRPGRPKRWWAATELLDLVGAWAG